MVMTQVASLCRKFPEMALRARFMLQGGGKGAETSVRKGAFPEMPLLCVSPREILLSC